MNWVERLHPGHLLWKAGAIVSIILLVLLTLLPSIDSGIKIMHIDKVYHLLAFFVITLLLQMAFIKTSRLGLVFIVTAFGLSIEVAQYFIPSRDFSWLDFLANSFGVLLAWTIFRPVDNRIKL